MFSLFALQEVDDRFMDTVASLSEKLKFTSTSGGGATGGVGSTFRGLGSPSGGGAGAGAGAGSSPAAETIRLEDLGVAPADTLAGRDALPELERLRVKTVTRVRLLAWQLCWPLDRVARRVCALWLPSRSAVSTYWSGSQS